MARQNHKAKSIHRNLRSIFAIIAVAISFVFQGSYVHADLLGHGGMVRAVTVSPDGRYALSGSFDFSAILWDFGEQEELAVLDAHEAPVNDVLFLNSSDRAVTASDDGSAIIWSLADPAKPVIQYRLTGHGHKVMAVAASPSGDMIATGGWDKTARLWDVASGKELKVLKAGSPVNALVFSHNGRFLVMGGHDGKIRLWNVETGTFGPVLEGHAMGITRLAASPLDGRLLSAGIDGTVRLWDMEAAKQLRKFEFHEKQAFTVAFSPDGKFAVSAGREGELIRWRLEGNSSPQWIAAHDAIIWSTAVTPDGRFTLTASSDETIGVWHLETGDRIGPVAVETDEPQPWLESDHPGAKLFTKCARCHSLTADGTRRSGPHFEKLFGRVVGQVNGYNYSSALREANFRWNAETLTALFDKGPDVFLPGTKMPVQRVTRAEDLQHLIDYLQIITGARN